MRRLLLACVPAALLACFLVLVGRHFGGTHQEHGAPSTGDSGSSQTADGDTQLGALLVDGTASSAHREALPLKQEQIRGSVSLGVLSGGNRLGKQRRLYFRDAAAPGRSPFHSATVLDDGSWSTELHLSEGLKAIRVGGCSIDDGFYAPVNSLVGAGDDGAFEIRLHETPGTAVLPFSSSSPFGIDVFELYTESDPMGSGGSISFPLVAGSWHPLGTNFVAPPHSNGPIVVSSRGYFPCLQHLAELNDCIIEPRLVPASQLYVALIDPLGMAVGDRFSVCVRSYATGAIACVSDQTVGLTATFDPIEPGFYVISVFDQAEGASPGTCAIDAGEVFIDPGEAKLVEADFSRPSRGQAMLSGKLILDRPGLEDMRGGFVRSLSPTLASAGDDYFFRSLSLKFSGDQTQASWGPIPVPACKLDLRLPGGTSGFLTMRPGDSHEVIEVLGPPRRIQVLCSAGVGLPATPAKKVDYARAGLEHFERGGFATFSELLVDDAGGVTIPEGDVWLRATLDGRTTEWKQFAIDSESHVLTLLFRELAEIHVLLMGSGLPGGPSTLQADLYPSIGSDSGGPLWTVASKPREVVEDGNAIRLVYEVPSLGSYVLMPKAIDGALPMPDRPFSLLQSPHTEPLEYLFFR